MRGIFVTGTDTNIGKTVVSAALMHRLRTMCKVTYWKPVQTGFPTDDDTQTVRNLGQCTTDEIYAEGIRLQAPVSPHLAAALAGTKISMREIIALTSLQNEDRTWVVEGAGGVLVPLNDTALMIDLICALKLPVVIAARSSLGTINHTLLTLEALRTRQQKITGVILVGERSADNRRAIEQYGDVPVLGEMPRFDALSPEALKDWTLRVLDPQNILNAICEGARQ